MLNVKMLVAAAVFAAVGFGQGGFGTISGRVTDASGSTVPNANVQATNVETNQKYDTTSDASGIYQLLQLRPGSYDLQAVASGFKRLEQKGLRLQVSDRLSIDLALSVGGTTDTITVTSEAPILRTEDAQQGEVVTTTFIRNLPQLQRDPLRLLTLAGNIQGDGSRAQPGSDTRINGGRTIGVEYIIDGITAGTGLEHNVVQSTPTMEMVAEFKVITNGISAEYGRASGGFVELVTRGGTNALHGEVFDYMQNDVFNANAWAQNAQGGSKVKFKQNIFGGWLGGPVVLPKIYNGRDRTFFTFNYQGERRRQAGSLVTLSVPTELERQGDFSQTVFNGIAPVLYDQNGPVNYDAASNTYTRTQLLGDGKRIPANRIHPVSKALLEFVPLPNQAPRPGTNNINNYVGPQTSRTDGDLWGFRLDHAFNDNNRSFFRFQQNDRFIGSSRVGGMGATANETRVQDAFTVTFNHDWSITPTLLLNVRAGGNHNPNNNGNLLPQGFSSASVPFDPITASVIGPNNAPTVGVSGLSNIVNSANLAVNNATSYNLGIGATKVAGRHTLKFGGEHRRYYDNFFNSGGGNYTFIASPVHQTAGVDFGSGSEISNAYGLAAFMVGVNNRANVSGDRTRANNFNYYAAYIQDDFKLSPRLTLNLGLRWDMETPVTERNDKLYVWDADAPPPFQINPGYNFTQAVRDAGLDPASVRTPSWVTAGLPDGALRIANTPEFPSRLATKYYPWQFAPRLGLAFQMTDKTVLRASFGQMYISTAGAAGAFSTGGEGIRLASGADAGWHASNDNLVHMISNWSNPYLPGQFTEYERTNTAANLQATGATGPSGFSRDSRMPHEFAYSVGVQREISNGWIAEATYNANLGRRLLGPDLISRFPADLFTGGPAGQNARTYTTPVASPTAGQTLENAVVGAKQPLAILEMDYPYFGAMAVQGSNIGRSNFHGLNLRMERRLWHGVSALVNYTFSKTLDDVGGPNLGNGSGVNGTNLGGKRAQTVDQVTAVYGISPIDEPHVIRFSYNWEIPVGRGKTLLGTPANFGTKALDFVVGGWELAGLGSYRSGRPVVIQGTSRNTNNNIRVEWTYASFGPGGATIDNPAFTDKNQVFYSTRDARPPGLVRRFDNVVDAQKFVYGTLPPIFPNLRHPSRIGYDMSLMKAFYFRPEGRQYLQFRMEGTNIFNIRGFGNYGDVFGTNDFGLITQAGPFGERRIQMSARIVF